MTAADSPAAGEARGAGAPDALEWAGWAALGLLTVAILILALFRPTSPGQLVNEIRLAAGVDRYQAAMNEGERLYSTGRAEIRLAGTDPAARTPVYRLFAQSIEHFQTARGESEGFYEDQRAQNAMADAYHAWAQALHEDGTGPWYKPNDRTTLRQARELVDEALALPDITGDRRVGLEDLGTKIDRAITPWPIL
jgi:hypothetical protein